MKVLYVAEQLFLHGGVEKVLSQKANYLTTILDYEVTIVTYRQQNRKTIYRLSEKVKLIDLGVNYDIGKSYFARANLKKLPAHIYRLNAAIAEEKPDVVVNCTISPDSLFLPFFQFNIPKIKEFHASGYIDHENISFKKRLLRLFQNFVFSFYAHLVVLTEDEKAYHNNDKVIVIPNSLEPQPDSARLVNKQVVAAGRIAPVKGFDQLIDAWHIIHKQQPSWQLHIYGDAYGATKKELEKRVASFGLENVILFKGPVADLKETLLEYSIYAMSSITECFPMVLLEAQSVGLPVVSYDCPNGPRNIIVHGQDGLLVANQNPEELAAGVLRLMEDAETRKAMGKIAKLRSATFDTTIVMQQWLRLFERLRNNAR
jgi:glycosyltransferase involved in cell wall biosynthesis